jgi:hypothetical protein
MAQPRRSLAKTKELLIDAGSQLLLEHGLRNALGHVTLTDAIDRLREEGHEVALGSAYRIWAASGSAPHGQAGFQRELELRAAAGSLGQQEGDSDIARVLVTAEPYILRCQRARTPSARRRIVSDFLREAVPATVRSLLDAPRWRIGIGMWAVATSGRSSDAELLESLTKNDDVQAQGLLDMYRQLADGFGLRERYEGSLHHLAVVVQAILQGLAIHATFHSEETFQSIPPGRQGSEQEWPLSARMVDLAVDEFLKPAARTGTITGPLSTEQTMRARRSERRVSDHVKSRGPSDTVGALPGDDL